MARVKLVKNALGHPHARRGISTVDVSDFEFPFSRKMPLQVPAEGLGQHRFPTANWSGDDRTSGTIRRGYIGKLRSQLSLNVFSPNQRFWNVIEIQHLRVSDDEPSADAVKIVHHIKRMLMSTVLKDVVSEAKTELVLSIPRTPVQGISSNW
jgi:hypothetical protein